MSDAHQRRTTAIATSPSHSHRYSYPEPFFANKEMPSLPSRWRTARTTAAFPQRILMRALELSLLALALFLVPATIQHFVRSLDTIYELVGRRARTTFDEVHTGWWRVGLGGGVLGVWHAALIALSYRAIMGKKRGYSWDRILGRIVVPTYLVGAGVVFAYTVVRRLAGPVVVPALVVEGEASKPYE